MAGDPFAPLRQEYRESAEQRRADVERLAPMAVSNAEARRELRKIAHNLRGSGGFYGFHAISAAAAALEELLMALEQGGAHSASDLLQAGAQLCEAILHARRS
jgi:chemotaxis protein histidine kinase CheA